MNANEILQSELKRVSVFTNEAKLSTDYIPENLPGREDQLRKIVSYMKTLIRNPGGMVPKISIIGPSGTGKTAVIKRLGKMIQEEFEKKDEKLKYIHINCRKQGTPHAILTTILKRFDSGFPNRGFNENELLSILNNEFLEKQNQFLLLCLDDADDFLLEHPSFLFKLLRIRDDWFNAKQRLALIIITKTPMFMKKLDESSKSSFNPKVVCFNKYTTNEVEEILRGRCAEAFLKSTVLKGAIKLVADLTVESGDARHALELLWLAGKYADEGTSVHITPEHVRQASSDLHCSLNINLLEGLSVHQLIILMGLVRYFKRSQAAYAISSVFRESYQRVCKELSIGPRKDVTIWNDINHICSTTEILGRRVDTIEGRPGRTTYFWLNVATNILEPLLSKLLADKKQVGEDFAKGS